MGEKNSIGDRMKQNYEDRYRISLTRRTPVILRVDGKAFHMLTRDLDKPFDEKFMNCMEMAAWHTASEMQGFKLGYIQSDEASFFLSDYDKLETEAWFDYNLNKIVSITAAYMTAHFNDLMEPLLSAVFDCRAFNLPAEEVANYFLWRAKDWERNSLMMYCQSFFSHKELLNKGKEAQHEMLYSIGKNWTDLPDRIKNGTFITKGGFRHDIIPTFEEINLLIQQETTNELEL